MDFGLSRQQEMIKNMVHEFAERELVPNADRWEDSGEFPREIMGKMAELHIFGTSVDSKYGGNSLGHLVEMIIVEELCRGYSPAGMYYTLVEENAWVLQQFAVEELKNKFIPDLCRGLKSPCFATTEPSGGSYVAGMQTTAEDTGDGYTINGRKVFISLAANADFALVAARHNGKIDIFLVERDTPGFEIPRREKYFGESSFPVSEVAFNNCYVPRNHLIGDMGSGIGMLLQMLIMHARPHTGAVAMGIARNAFEAAIKFARERKLGGTAVGEFQAIQMMLADMDTEIDAARWLVYQCAWLLDQGKTSREVAKESARVKYYCVEMAINVCRRAVQIMGGYGVSLDFPPIRRLNDALLLLPASGTPEITRILVARELLKR